MPHNRHPRSWRHKLITVCKFAVAPLGAAGLAIVIWWQMPHAEIPAAFRANLANQENEVASSSKDLQTAASHPSVKASHTAVLPSAKSASTTASDASDASTAAASAASASTVSTASASAAATASGQGQAAKSAKSLNPALGTTTPRITSKQLVSLGDSITFGYGLPGAQTNHPSHDAYPFLVASSQGWQVTDLGVPGWTSTDLLHALGTAKFQSALQKANIVTIDIGSNDLLHASYNFLGPDAQLPAKDAVTSSALMQQALSVYETELPEIIADVKKQTDAPIVLLNLYDPFPDASSLHNVSEQVVSAANNVIWEVAAENNLPVVDVHAAFNHNQATDVRLDSLDIHPTQAGQELIAKLVDDTIAGPLDYVPAVFVTSGSGSLVYSQVDPGPFAIAWLRGNQGLLVVGQTAKDWQVVTQNGQTGYVAKQNVSVLLRPFADVQFGTISANLTMGTASASDYSVPPATAGSSGGSGGSANSAAPGSHSSGGSGGSAVSEAAGTLAHQTAQGFTYKGQAYVPVNFVASVTNSTVSQDDKLNQVNLDTPMHSGLIQQGWDTAGSGATTSVNSGTVATPTLQYVPGKTAKHANLTESAWMLSIDGEPVDLGEPILEWNGQLYVPLRSVWTSLGGIVTPGTGGLLKLSVTGS